MRVARCPSVTVLLPNLLPSEKSLWLLTYDHGHGAAVALAQSRQDLAHHRLIGQDQIGDTCRRSWSGEGSRSHAVFAATDLLLIRHAAVSHSPTAQGQPSTELFVPRQRKLHQHVDQLDEVKHQFVSRRLSTHGFCVPWTDYAGKQATEARTSTHGAVCAAAGNQLIRAGDVVVDQKGDGLDHRRYGGHRHHLKVLLQSKLQQLDLSVQRTVARLERTPAWLEGSEQHVKKHLKPASSPKKTVSEVS